MCLDIEGGGRGVVGSPLVQAPCDGTPSQKWYVHKLVDDGLFTGKGYRYFFNDLSEQVMDVAGASLSTGALIVQFPKKPLSSSGNQLFNQGFGGIG